MNIAGRALVLLGAVLALAAVVAATEQARSSSTGLGLALGVTAPDVRLATAADVMIVHGTPPSASDIAAARRAAGTEPLSPLPFYILGAGGQTRDAGAAVAASLRRDPRFRPAYRWQAAMLARSGDIGGATRALIRLAVLSPGDELIWPAIAQLTVNPAARAAIKREIAHGAPWRDDFLTTLGASSVDRAIVFEMLQTAGKRAEVSSGPVVPGHPDDRRAFIAAMIARKDYERAYLAWVQWLPAASQGAVGYIFDGDFKGLAALPPFAWQLSDGAGGTATIDRTNGLSLDYSGTDGVVLANQMVLLSPGRYQLSTTAKFDAANNENGVSPLVWSLTCVSDARALGDLAVPLDGSSRRVTGGAIVIDGTCPAQMLTLKVNSADFAKRLSGHIRSVAVQAVNG